MTDGSRRTQRYGAPGARRILLAAALLAAASVSTVAAPPPRAPVAKTSAAVVTISLLPAAATARAEVTIGEVATVEGGETGLRTRIAALDLADAPDLGKTAQLTRELVAHRIRIAGIDAQRFRIQGAESVALTSRGRQISEHELVAAAKELLLTRLPWNAEDITIEQSGPIKGTVQVSGARDDVRLEARLRSPNIALGIVRVDVAILSKGVKQAEAAVPLEVHHYDKIAVSSRRIDRGQTLAADDVYFERRIVDHLSGYLTEAESPVGQRLKRAVLPLQPIAKGDLESAESDGTVVVKQRDVIRLVARAGNLTISATGEALQDGRTGQMIRVRNVDSKAVVTGRVINRNEVQVIY